METVVLENEINIIPSPPAAVEGGQQHRAIDADAQIIHLGIWLSGIDAFASAGGRPFVSKREESTNFDLVREFRIVRLTLQRCAHSIFLLVTAAGNLERTGSGEIAVGVRELRDLGHAIRHELIQAEGLNRLDAVGVAEFRAWGDAMLGRLRAVPAYVRLSAMPDMEIEQNLPQNVGAFARNSVSHGEVVETMFRFGRILTVLAEIGRMLERDEPLKPAVLVFAKVHAMTLEMIDHLNRRVARLGEAGGELADSIDGASYTAAIELKKAVGQELVGLMSMRAATGVYARTEAAYSLLAESFQQIITVLARQIDPSANMFEMFPNFRTKLDRSVMLRRDLHEIANLARSAEAKPERQQNEQLISKLVEFTDASIRNLFYKDIETFERFVEEIRVTKKNKDLVPILHRFGAYLETLFAQVNMRAVLEGQPFEK